MQADDVGGHSPVIVQCLAALLVFALEGSVPNLPENLFIVGTPFPQGNGQVYLFFPIDQGKTEAGVLFPLLGQVDGGDEAYPLIGQPLGRRRDAPHGGPIQVDLGTGVGHLYPQGKGVDPRNLAEYGIVADKAHMVPPRKGTGNRPHDELCLVHSGIVGADIAVGLVQGTVEDDDVRVVYGRPQAGGEQAGGGGEEDGVPVRDGLLNHLLGVIVHCVKIGGGLQLLPKHPVDVLAAQLMAVGPAGDGGGFVVDKGCLQLFGRGFRQYLGEDALVLFLRRQLYRDGQLLLLEAYLLPHLGKLFFQLRPILALELPKAVDFDIGEHRVSHGGGQLTAPVGLIGLTEVIVGCGKVPALLLGPGVAGALAHQPLNGCITARLGKLQDIEPAGLVEFGEFIVQLHLLGAVSFRHDACNLSGDGYSVKEFQHTDPLVPLLHIKAVEVFIGLDRIPDALLQVGLAEAFPLEAKLTLGIQKGHKAAGKRVGPSCCPGANNQLRGDMDNAQRHTAGNAFGGEKIIQSGKVRVFSLGNTSAELPLSALQGVKIVIGHNKHLPAVGGGPYSGPPKNIM